MSKTIYFLCIGALLLSACAQNQAPAKVEVVNLMPADNQVTDEQIHLKKKIAIGRFTNETRLANSFLNEGSNIGSRMSKSANDILASKLAITNRFILIERQDELVLDVNQQVANIDQYQIPADYIILGSITEFGTGNTGNVGLIDRTKKQTAFAKVNLRILDTHTGRVIYGEEGAGEASTSTSTVLGMGSQAGYDTSLADKAIDAAIGSVIDNIVAKLSQDKWRSYILQQENNQLIISGGEKQGIRVGDVFSVYLRGKTVMNPQTNIPIELPGNKIASIKITKLIPGDEISEVSYAEIIEGLVVGELSSLYVVEK
ncbi:MAG: CsgG/HfaB family protein [Candidatus Cloacimonas sp.]|nr:CsgG/HfaB family protein [Candidatus Cloacimonas sp.]